MKMYFLSFHDFTLQTLGEYISSVISDENEEIDSRLEVVESILLGSTENVFIDGGLCVILCRIFHRL